MFTKQEFVRLVLFVYLLRLFADNFLHITHLLHTEQFILQSAEDIYCKNIANISRLLISPMNYKTGIPWCDVMPLDALRVTQTSLFDPDVLTRPHQLTEASLRPHCSGAQPGRSSLAAGRPAGRCSQQLPQNIASSAKRPS